MNEWVGIIVILTALLVLFFWWYWPKAQPFDFGASMIGYYRGLGLADEDVFLIGKSYFRVEMPSDDGGRWLVEYRGPGYNEFNGHSPINRNR